ncbi:MAG: ComEC/Rec2 family competence protein [Ahrensia sp.]|nr:ComEC/Rec2 family competence protein [Ahrensia sp.]
MAPNGSKRSKSGVEASDDGLWLPVDQHSTDSDQRNREDASPKARQSIVDRIRYQHAEPVAASRIRFGWERFSSIIFDWIARCIAREGELGTAFLCAPICFGVGCALYFALPREPVIGAFAGVSLIMLLAAWRLGSGQVMFNLLAATGLLCAGVAAAQFRAASVDTAMMSRTVTAMVTGVVERAELRGNGRVRYTLNVSRPAGRVDFRGEGARPDRVRLSARMPTAAASNIASVGDTISGRARVGPPSGPAYPGAFDFSFQAWFAGLGGSGFFLGQPQITASSGPSGFAQHLTALRGDIAQIIRSTIPGRQGAIAAALIVGDRSGLDEETAEALRQSGLAHILAISGLHMALVAATVMYVLRFSFALSPALSLHYPARKWAAGGALAFAAAYLALSGASVSAQRAFIMIAVMLIAVLFDRRALTMRNVAIAALVILAIAPESVLMPGFQMSFAAVAALVATYSALAERARKRANRRPDGPIAHLGRRALRNLAGLALTSLVAGLATGLFAAYHFHRVAPMGLLANLLAMPLVSFLVMPAALISMIAMPFGLEALPLQLMGEAISHVVTVARWVAGIGPSGVTGHIPMAALLWGSLGLLVLTVSTSALRWFALAAVVPFVLILAQRDYPDILIHEQGRQIALRGEAGQMLLLRPKADRFTTRIWSRAFWPGQMETEATLTGNPFTCDAFGCTARIAGATLTHLTNTAQIHEDCRLADILVVPYRLDQPCSFLPAEKRPVIIDLNRLGTLGAHALYLREDNADRGTLRIVTAYGRTQRPWTRYRGGGVSQ